MSWFIRQLFFCLIFAINSLALASYTKVSNSGKALPDSAVLGSGANDWACTYDSSTKLIWEVKTSDRGLRDKSWVYTWYDSNSATNDGNAGVENGTYSKNCDKSSYCNTQDFQQRVNAQGLCGSQDWRLPSREELMTLVFCSNGTYNNVPIGNQGEICPKGGTDQQPTINQSYFPNTSISSPSYGWYFTASPYLFDYGSGISYAWSVKRR